MIKSLADANFYIIFVSQTTRYILKFVGKLTPGVVSRRDTAVSVSGLKSSSRTEKLKGEFFLTLFVFI